MIGKAQSPEYQLKNYNTEHGLSHDVISSITQDQTGFLWVATWDGISRFDGHEFRNYYHNPDDPGSLPFFIPNKVIVDRLNNVWVLTWAHPAFVYDRAGDSFRPAFKGDLKTTPVYDMIIGSDENIWLSLKTTVCRYDPGDEKLMVYKVLYENQVAYNFPQNSPLLSFDNTGGLWLVYRDDSTCRVYYGIISGETITCRYVGSLSVGHYRSYPLRNAQLNPEINIDDSGNLWLICKYGIFVCDTERKEFKAVKSVDRDLFNNRGIFYWMDESSGINILDAKNNSILNLPLPAGDYAECIYFDRSGTLWSSNINQAREGLGLNRYTKVPDYFSHYVSDKNEDSSVNIVFPVLKDRNQDLWIGTRYQSFLRRIKPDGTETKFYLFSGKQVGNSSVAKCMAEDGDGIWFGTTSGELFYYSDNKEKADVIYPVTGINDHHSIPGIHNIICRGNALVINGSEGIYTFDPELMQVELIYRHRNPGTGFSFIKDERNGFWLGTWGSCVIHLDSALKKMNEFTLGKGGNIVEHICIGDSSDIWVALMGGGLGHLYPETGKMEIFTTSDGLSNNVTYSIVKDNKGCLWISTNQGISMFNPATRHFRNYGKADGLLITEFNSDSFFRTSSGEIFFGGIGGVVGFHPDSVGQNHNRGDQLKLALTDIRVSGISRYLSKAPYETDTIRLEKGDNNFQVKFTMFDITSPEKISYRYRLVGEDDGWIITDHRTRSISCSHLKPKDYTLELQATNERGEWAISKSIFINIPRRLLEYPLVIIILSLLFLAPLVFAGLSYARQLRLMNRQLKFQLRLESLRGQMNPHFIFNSLNSINYFISKEDKIAANNYIADFSGLIRSILENFGSDYIPLEKEIQSLNDYLKLEYLRFGDRFSYFVSSEKISSHETWDVTPGLVQPFVENAIWHGVRNLEERSGHITVDFMIAGPDKLRCIIEDDGIGMKQSLSYKSNFTDHNSRGIDLVKERLRVFNTMSKGDYKVVIEDLYPKKEETGTRVTVDLPAKSHQ